MGLSADALKHGIDSVARLEPRVAEALARAGYPAPRISQRGATTLMRTIVGQQISFKAADSVWAKFTGLVGDPTDMAHIAALPIETLRSAGLSGQKAGYVQSLAEHVASGALNFDALPADNDEAVAALVAVKGIGRWSAEIYLLFAEGRLDIWPAGDLAVQIELGRILGLENRPTEKATRELVEPWRPHRGAMAVFMWHHYKTPVI